MIDAPRTSRGDRHRAKPQVSGATGMRSPSFSLAHIGRTRKDRGDKHPSRNSTCDSDTRFGVWVCWYTWYAFQFSARTPVQARVSDCFAESRHISSVTVTVALRKMRTVARASAKKKLMEVRRLLRRLFMGRSEDRRKQTSCSQLSRDRTQLFLYFYF